MECKNHPGVQAADRCAACAEAFCPNCLVEMGGQKYCGSCKVVALKGAPPIEAATLPCKEAGSALVMAIIGIFIFGVILGPLAISKAMKAKKMIELNPRLTGSGKATAALVIGIIDIVFFLMFLATRFSNLSK